VLLIPTTIRPAISALDSDALRITAALTISVTFWTVSPIVLTGHRLTARQALPAGFLAALAMTTLGAASALWLPHSVATSAQQYGLIGVAFAFVSWLVGAGLTLAASTVAGAVISEAFSARTERRAQPAG
jgi:membrane protein